MKLKELGEFALIERIQKGTSKALFGFCSGFPGLGFEGPFRDESGPCGVPLLPEIFAPRVLAQQECPAQTVTIESRSS